MRRIMLMAVTSSALALAAPGVASAHHSRHHHSRTHHAHKARFRHFGSLSSTTTQASPSTSAGTVTSFNEGVLTITLADNTTVSGKVTDATELSCVKAGTGGDDNDNDEQGDENHAFMSDHHDGVGGDDQGDDDQGDNNGGSCTTAALVPGASQARLRCCATAAG